LASSAAGSRSDSSLQSRLGFDDLESCDLAVEPLEQVAAVALEQMPVVVGRGRLARVAHLHHDVQLVRAGGDQQAGGDVAE
jgi:hypothetical protein